MSKAEKKESKVEIAKRKGRLLRGTIKKTTLQAYANPRRGGIIAVGLLATGAACELYRAFMAGRSVEAGRLQERIGPLHKRVVAGTGVPGVKYGLDLLGMVGGPPRPPLLPPTDREREDVVGALERAGLAPGQPQSI